MDDEAASSRWWYQLEEKMKKKILGWLPLDCLFKFRSVCSQWNALLSSTEFIRNDWAVAPPNRRPMLLVCPSSSAMAREASMAYCFYTQTWKRCISFSFLQTRGMPKYELWPRSGSAGLFLAGIPDLSGQRVHVLNPFSETTLQLPVMRSIRTVEAMGIMQSGPENIYKVVAVGESRRGQNVKIVEMYDSSQKSWRIAGNLPPNVKVLWGRWMLYCDGFFYFTAFLSPAPAWNDGGIVVFNMADGTSIYARLPLQRPETGARFPQLVVCGSRVLVVADSEKLIMWEFDHRAARSKWKQIQRMVPPVHQTMNSDSKWWFDCVGVGDHCVCFTTYEGGSPGDMKVLLYNLRQNSWSSLPTCPTTTFARSISFEPRPNMDVG